MVYVHRRGAEYAEVFSVKSKYLDTLLTMLVVVKGVARMKRSAIRGY
jgi:hypothetical protein